MLFLLLLSGESLKWAKLSNTQEQYMSDAQVLLTTGVVVAVVSYGFCTLGFVRRGAKVNGTLSMTYASKLARLQLFLSMCINGCWAHL